MNLKTILLTICVLIAISVVFKYAMFLLVLVVGYGVYRVTKFFKRSKNGKKNDF